MKERNVTFYSFLFLLMAFIVFFILKLAGAIDWSWWWVSFPIWFPMVLFLGLIVMMLMFVWLATQYSKGFERELYGRRKK